MRRSEARAALEAARDWDRRGLFQPGAFDQVEQELAPQAAEGEPSLAMQTFYAVGGILLGAATAALYVLLETNGVLSDRQGEAWTFFLASAAVLLGAALATVVAAKQDELGDALLLAGLVPTAILLGPRPPGTDLLFLVPLLVAVAVLVYRRDRVVVPVAALVLALVAIPGALMQILNDERIASFYWLLAAIATLAGTLAWSRTERPQWHDVAAFAPTVAAAISMVMFVGETLRPDWQGGTEVLVGIGFLALLGVGVWVRERAMLFAGGGALTIDAIVFAFDVGGVTWGLLTLLALSGALIAVATVLRRRGGTQTESSPPASEGP